MFAVSRGAQTVVPLPMSLASSAVYETYANTKAWIWNATEKSEKEISNRGSYVHWATFDDRVYLWEEIDGIAGKVFAYSPLSGSVAETSHKAFIFLQRAPTTTTLEAE